MHNKSQGNIDHYSIQKQITRRQNRKSPGFVAAVGMIWEATRAEMVGRMGGSCDAGGHEDGVPGIDKAAFVCLMVKVHYLIICPPVRRGLARLDMTTATYTITPRVLNIGYSLLED